MVICSTALILNDARLKIYIYLRYIGVDRAGLHNEVARYHRLSRPKTETSFPESVNLSLTNKLENTPNKNRIALPAENTGMHAFESGCMSCMKEGVEEFVMRSRAIIDSDRPKTDTTSLP